MSLLLRTVVLATAAVANPGDCGKLQEGIDFAGFDLGFAVNVSNAADCCELCVREIGCNVFTYKSSIKRCLFKTSDAGARSEGDATSGKANVHRSCDTEMDCSLAGDCVNGTCVCDPWVRGPNCAILALKDADPEHYGYRNASGYNSWGGHPVPGDDGKWYLFASQIRGGCPLLGFWLPYSLAIRAVSDHPMGPYKMDATIVTNFAHNVQTFVLKNGTALMYYIGNATDEAPTDKGNCSLPLAVGDYPIQAGGPCRVAYAPSLTSPPEDWVILPPLTDSLEWHSDTNPSPYFFDNGTILLATSRRYEIPAGTGNYKNTWMMSSDSFFGPYRNLTTTPGPRGEDPTLFKTKRGFHMLMHNGGPAGGRLSYSEDGINWITNDDLAYNGTVKWANGSVTDFCQRQRPQVLLDDTGMPRWLWNGVMDQVPGCPAQTKTWTFVQEFESE